MNQFTTTLTGIFAFILLAIIAVFIFTAPAWWIWNNIVSIKFGLPMFSFWEAFLTILMVRFILPSITTKSDK